jgi:hypothetical protein
MKFITHTILLPKEAQTEQPAQQPQQQVPTPHPVKQKQYSSQQIMDWSKSLDPLFQRMIARMLSQNDSQEVQTLNKAVAGDVQSRQWLMNKFNEFKSSQPAQQQNPNQQNPNQQNPNQQQEIGTFTVQDPTNTKYGKAFANHTNSMIVEILQEGQRDTLPDAILRFIETQGATGSLYESIHQAEDKNESQKILQQNYLDVANMIPSSSGQNGQNGQMDYEQIDEAFKKHVFDNVANALSGTDMKFSQSMSEQQSNNMLWIRANKRDLNGEVYKHRIYINAKPVSALNVLKHVAETYTQLCKKQN